MNEEEEHYEEPDEYIGDNEPDCPEDFERIEEQNAEDEYEAMQSANAEAQAMAEQEAQRAEAEYQELHKDCIPKAKITELKKKYENKIIIMTPLDKLDVYEGFDWDKGRYFINGKWKVGASPNSFEITNTNKLFEELGVN